MHTANISNNIYRKLTINHHINQLLLLTEISPKSLKENGLIKYADKPVKVLGHGELKKGINVKVHAISKNAKKLIEKSGGTVTIL